MLFTGKGDNGTTRDLRGGGRLSKASALPEALGALDGLNSFVGLCKVKTKGEMAQILREVQETLFVIQAEVAGAPKSVAKERVEEIEKIIREIEAQIPPLKGFSVAGGTELSALLDVARTIARRMERRLVALAEMGHPLGEGTKAYINRLSSLLFALARLANHEAGVAEETPHY